MKVGDRLKFSILDGGPYRVNTLLTYSSGKAHGGIDIGTPIGTKLYAPFDGKVVACVDGVRNNRAGERIYSGKPSNWILLLCKIRTTSGNYQNATIFLQHLSPGLAVKTGQNVKAGQYLGKTGNSGNSTGPHLHAGAQWVRASRGHGSATRYDHINNKDLRVWPPERFVNPPKAAPAPTPTAAIIVKEATVAGWHKYSGKPSGLLRVPTGRYVTIDCQIPAIPKGGVKEDRMVYLNIKPVWKLPKSDPMYYFQTASVRVRWQRVAFKGQPADDTGYQDFTITPWRDEFLLTHLHWELSEAGRGGKWHMNIVGHVTSAVVGTRYSKGSSE